MLSATSGRFLPFRDRVAGSSPGERQFVAVAAGTTCRWMWNTVWKAALPSLMAMLLASASPQAQVAIATRCPISSIPARVSGGCRSGRGCASWYHQGVTAGERANVQKRQVMVVLVDTDGRSAAGDDLTEHARHAATVASVPTRSLRTRSIQAIPVDSVSPHDHCVVGDRLVPVFLLGSKPFRVGGQGHEARAWGNWLNLT